MQGDFWANTPNTAKGVIQLDENGQIPESVLQDTGVTAPLVDIASAATCAIGAAASENVNITGTTTITSFGTIAAGVKRTIVFAGILTLTHNGTSLILPGGANITTAAGDSCEAISLGSGNWKVISYQKASGAAVVSGGQSQLVTSHGVNVSPSTTSYIGISGSSTVEDYSTFCVAPRAMTISNLYVRTSDAQHSGGSLVITIRKNGVDTALTLTIVANAAAGIFSNTTNSFTVVAGDVITIKAQNNSGGSSAATLRNISMVVE
jgi:hypothetical protein